MSQQKDTWEIAVDTGGTFTDCVAVSPEGKTSYVKVLSSGRLRGQIISIEDRILKVAASWLAYGNIFEGYQLQVLGKKEIYTIQSIDIENSILQINEVIDIKSDSYFQIFTNEEAPVLAARLATRTPLFAKLPPMQMRVGSTKGTNALLEGKGAKTAFITNKGLEDLLQIGTQQRPNIFQLEIPTKKQLYTNVFGISGRVGFEGNELTPFEENEVQEIIHQIKTEGIEAVAVALMHSYRYPKYEQQLKKALNIAGVRFISCSEELAPLIKILPRANTAVINAYLSPIIEAYLSNIAQHVAEDSLLIMSSAGSLHNFHTFNPKDSLLSGPAGGVVGAAESAKKAGYTKILTLDMGGTSTDVAHFNNRYDYQFETSVGDAQLFSPSLYIETVAAGGGSLCQLKDYTLEVGPESAGAEPGPACYGNGGGLSITDINLLLGRTDPNHFGIPLKIEAAQDALNLLMHELKAVNYKTNSPEEILSGLLDIANEKMANAMRKISVDKGYDPTEYAMLAFGGAGGQHAAAIAELLNMKTVIVPYEAGVLSASGIAKAQLEKFESAQVLQSLEVFKNQIEDTIHSLKNKAVEKFKEEGCKADKIILKNIWLYLRLKGQEASLEIELSEEIDIQSAFKEAYIKLYKHWVEDVAIEVESLKVMCAVDKPSTELLVETPTTAKKVTAKNNQPTTSHSIRSFFDGKWYENVPVFEWEELEIGASTEGPALLVSQNSTTVIPVGWEFSLDADKTAILERVESTKNTQQLQQSEAVELSLFTNRFSSIAAEMGALLERTAFSVNVKERLDFSCALLDAEGELLVNAPHIPVHLGSLGICTRKVHAALNLSEGDIAITNHPGFGGSHLPDITLIAPIFHEGILTGYVANRAHHAELGGKRPGSMPPDAASLEEEGVVIPPQFLFKKGVAQWEEISNVLSTAKYPTRSIEENMADLRAAVASLQSGMDALLQLADNYGRNTVVKYMEKLKSYSEKTLQNQLQKLPQGEFEAVEYLDDDSPIKVKVTHKNESLLIDFSGSGETHPKNLNANPSIINSAVIYVLRLLAKRELPLNEGLMKMVEVILPENSILNPHFPEDPAQCPAVVGGNTETSQRVTDTLLKAFGLAACSQGTMNNFLFGNDEFGYYETICGGVGATDGYHGASAVHQHMTNTRITDPEILEFRYPVVLEKFGIRKGSGGKGKWNGGNGIERILKFTQDVSITTLMQHRKQAPYGLHGGNDGAIGQQWVEQSDGSKIILEGTDQIEVSVNDKITILTPGGGGWGKA